MSTTGELLQCFVYDVHDGALREVGPAARSGGLGSRLAGALGFGN